MNKTDDQKTSIKNSRHVYNKKYYVYMLECADESLYTGYTTDVARRLGEHSSGKGSKYTRGRCPVTLVHIEAFHTVSEALKRESAIKKLTPEKKCRLINT